MYAEDLVGSVLWHLVVGCIYIDTSLNEYRSLILLLLAQLLQKRSTQGDEPELRVM